MSHTFRHSAGFGKRMEYWIIGKMLKEGLDVYVPLVDDVCFSMPSRFCPFVVALEATDISNLPHLAFQGGYLRSQLQQAHHVARLSLPQ